MEAGNYVSSKQAAQILGISVSTVYRMVKKGVLTPSKTPGGQRRFDKKELEDYLEASKGIVAPQNPYRAKNAERVTEEETTEILPHGELPDVDPRNRLNDLSGKEWIPATKSYMMQKGLGANHPHTQIERQHPAPYSFQDVAQLITFFTKRGQSVLDPFGGVGSTAKACALHGRVCTQIELSDRWHALAMKRLESEVGPGTAAEHTFIHGDCIPVLQEMADNQFDFVITSPPYWSILNKKADHKVTQTRVNQNLATTYSDSERDLGNIPDYEAFLNILVNDVFRECGRVLRTNQYMAIVVSDFRNKSEFISFHSDLIQRINHLPIVDGTVLNLQGIKILVQNHKSLMPYGYPFAYVENIHHQYILIFRKMVP
ncbi:MAG: DNA methyltransferase [Oscillospiraceae bacterium]|jgi:excisionase family DNA binding protein